MLKIIFVFILLSVSYEQSKVYYIKKISSENILKIFKELNVTLGNKVGLKVHSGEKGGQYYVNPLFLQEIYDYTKGTFIECNAAYNGSRSSTKAHQDYILLETNWTKNNKTFVIMDANPNKDFCLNVKNPLKINKNYVGEKLNDFDSCVVLSHFKGHTMTGYGGALKQLSLGFASQKGKAYIHTASKTNDWKEMKEHLASREDFTKSMVDAASTIIDYFNNKSGIVYINFMSNITMECDCHVENVNKPNLSDYGILASLDPVALDRACIDIIKNTSAYGRYEWLNQLNELQGENILTIAENQGMGSQKYELIEISDSKTGYLIAVILSTVGGVTLFVGLFVGLALKNPKQKTQEDFHLTQKMNE